jgi:serine/threonine protein kinase
MEYLKLGDLEQYLSRMPPLLEEAAGDVIYQILEGLSYMHKNSFAHRDLKPGVRPSFDGPSKLSDCI